jgi:SAM-dependent methyltransferase
LATIQDYYALSKNISMTGSEPFYINLICDPLSKEELRVEGDYLSNSHRNYPIIKGIPVMLLNSKDLETESTKLLSGRPKIGFSWAASHWHDLKIEELLGKCNHENNLLLNFGSGSPLEKVMMQNLGYQVISIDINANYKGVDVIGDGHYLPFKNEVFGTVTAFEVLEHLHTPWIAIKEINRVLCENGRFIGSVAFLKEFHSSYFHMSHWGVRQLLEYGGFEIEKLYGGQNIFSRLVHNILPLGPSGISKWLYDRINNLIMFSRKTFWSVKKRKSAKEISTAWDIHPFSFEELEKITFAPTVLFSAKKVRNV